MCLFGTVLCGASSCVCVGACIRVCVCDVFICTYIVLLHLHVFVYVCMYVYVLNIPVVCKVVCKDVSECILYGKIWRGRRHSITVIHLLHHQATISVQLPSYCTIIMRVSNGSTSELVVIFYECH